MSKATNGQPPVQKKPSKGKYEQWLTEDGLTRLQAWARDGLTEEQIAHNCGIGRTTLKRWKAEHQAIRTALKDGKEVIDILVENALLKRALGYEYIETTHERVVVGIDEETHKPIHEMALTKTVTKMVIPDTTAQIYWLKNRKRDVWKNDHDKAEIEKMRLELDERKVEADLKDKGNDSTIRIVMSDELRELAE